MANTAIITEAAGLIGSGAVRFFAEKGFKIIGIYNDMRRYFFGDAASIAPQLRESVGRDGGYTATVADACVIVPTVNPQNVTPHTEAFQAVVWHLPVSHPKLKVAETKWESTNRGFAKSILSDYSLDTVKMFYEDGRKAGFTL